MPENNNFYVYCHRRAIIKKGSISNYISGRYKTSGGFKWFKYLNKKGGCFA